MTDEIIILNEENIEKMICEIRGQKVILDFDLAKIYGYETKAFNQQVKNNITRFPDDFRFQLTQEEAEEISRCKFFTPIMQTTGIKGGRTTLPYAFTEQGIYMLMTVLKGDLAVEQSKTLIRLFKSMKDYLAQENSFGTVNEVLALSKQVQKNTMDIEKMGNKLDIIMDNFIDPTTYKHFLIMNGQKIEAAIAFQTIYSLAKDNLIIIDNYIDITSLHLLKVCKSNIKITICSDNVARNKLTDEQIESFHLDSGLEIMLKPTNEMVHDRYVIIDYKTKDEIIYHCGPSPKDAGNKIGTIVRLEKPELYHQVIDDLVNN